MESFSNDNETNISDTESTKETKIPNNNINTNIIKRKSISTTKSTTKKKALKSSTKKHKQKSASKDKSSKTKTTNKKQKKVTKPKQLQSQPFKKETPSLHIYNKALLSNLFSKYSEPKDIILNYMLIQTRPYNTTNIFDELNGQINKQQIQHTLDSLTTESKLISKEYNNTKLYMINQSTLEQVSQDQINIVDNNIKYYKDKLNTLTLQYQQKQNELTQLTHEYTDEQIDILITQMKEKKQMLLNKVSQIQMIMNNIDNSGVIQEDKMEQYEKIYNNMLLKYKTIRKVCLNIIDQIADEMEMKSNKVKDIIGIINEKSLIEKYNINIY